MSDLWAEAGNFVVGFMGGSPNSRSELVDARGQQAGGTTLHAWGLYAQEPGAALRWPLRQIVEPSVEVLDDPLRFFLDRLVNVPVSSRVTGVLRHDGRAYLLPFSREFLRWFDPMGVQVMGEGSGPARQAVSVSLRTQEAWTVVELWVPVRNGLFVRASRRYDNASIEDRWVPRIAVWPDFESDAWESYFYYRGELGRGRDDELVLEPSFRGAALERRKSTGSQWWRTTRPAMALLASDYQGREMGLALGPFARSAPRPTSHLRLAVDLGSTHTRLFTSADGVEPRPLKIHSRATLLTGKESGVSDQEFFRLDIHPPMSELPTQVLMPFHQDERLVEVAPENWMPADGVAVLGQVHRDFVFDNDVRLSTDVKWNLEPLIHDPAAIFLSHLLLLAQAEAFDNGAVLSEISYSHPSAFPDLLRENFEHRWQRLLPGRPDASGGGGDRPAVMENGGSEAEAFAVMKYLAVREGAAPATTLLAIDIGGSTSDIAIWQGNSCHCLESIRFAASAISSYLCLDSLWRPYCEILPGLGLKKDGPLQGDPLALPPENRLPLLYAMLNYLEEKKQIGALRMQFESKERLKPFLVHCSFVYGALLYYLGVLARELGKGEAGQGQQYYIHLCGKGAKFFEWLERDSASSGLRSLFLAGLSGPGSAGSQSAGVSFKLSENPKWEVGYGRLLDARFERGGKLFADDEGHDRLAPRSVRIGEKGYLGSSPHDPLNLDKLRDLLKAGPAAVPQSFPEFENFLSAWEKTSYSFRPTSLPSGFRGALTERLLGRVQGSIGFEVADTERARRLSLEPLFVTQSKVFYELTAGVHPSLWLGKVPGRER